MGTNKMQTDIVVVGGGLSGLAAAVFCAGAGFSTVHLAPDSARDPRTSALMGPSVSPLIQAGLIKAPEKIGTPLTKIRIIDCTQRLFRAPETLFDSATNGETEFGWNFSNAMLREAFEAVAQKLDTYSQINASLASFSEDDSSVKITTNEGTKMHTQMLVGADGKSSIVRRLAGISAQQHAHKQSALVCDLRLERGLDGTSVEFHYENGPFTLVPAGGDIANLVWIDKEEVLQDARNLSKVDLQAAFTAKAQNLFGRMELLSPTAVFPLSTLRVQKAGIGRVALVGEAAHAFPPIGAQGLNLGIRDVVALRQALDIVERGASDWARGAVAAYAKERSSDLNSTTNFVEGLFNSLIVDFVPAQLLRAAGLWTLKLSPSVREKAVAFGMGAH